MGKPRNPASLLCRVEAFFRSNGPATKQQLEQALGASWPSIRNAIENLHRAQRLKVKADVVYLIDVTPADAGRFASGVETGKSGA